jgi:hypothetical protein
MILQLRTYTLKPGSMDAWRTVWRDQIKPIREGLGFVVPAAWEVPEKNQFVWLMAYSGSDDWATLDAAFHASPERKAIAPDPAGMIVSMDTRFLDSVG